VRERGISWRFLHEPKKLEVSSTDPRLGELVPELLRQQVVEETVRSG